MAHLQINGILARQYISEKSGKATVTLFDLDTARELTVTLQDAVLDEKSMADRSPRAWVLTGIEIRSSEQSGKYIVASTIHLAK